MTQETADGRCLKTPLVLLIAMEVYLGWLEVFGSYGTVGKLVLMEP